MPLNQCRSTLHTSAMFCYKGIVGRPECFFCFVLLCFCFCFLITNISTTNIHVPMALTIFRIFGFIPLRKQALKEIVRSKDGWKLSIYGMPTYLLIICLFVMWLNCPESCEENNENDGDDQLPIKAFLYSITLKFFKMIISFILLLIFSPFSWHYIKLQCANIMDFFFLVCFLMKIFNKLKNQEMFELF